MKTLLAALAVSVLLAAVVTQLAATVFPGAPLALFLLVAASGMLASWAAVRKRGRTEEPADP